MPCQHEKRKAWCQESPCRDSPICWFEGHSGYQKQKKYCRDCLCSLYSCLGGIYTSCWIKGHSGYGKANTECRDCQGVALGSTKGQTGYGKANTECRDFQEDDLCQTAGHSGYHHHKKFCLNCQQSTGKNRRKEKLERRKKNGSFGSFWSKGKGNSADTIVMAECVCVIL